ncbi:MAG: glycosyltransferase family 4 protein [Acidithiobacillus ferrooxidans]|nr:glycosyltransferase family 4 protein [Acidithiobacillus ferrooxidans]MDD5002622.1 glycosyltransferase family 4 protein [Acidithiobacillus sp.]MDD5379143.1 glycosyltransferase family 4 protein [Acidithiobacillus sp.]MDD5575518.1 glycosyltransferase family 4 protein [Acidithiobacillus sp.]
MKRYSSPVFFTICARNYLALAAALGESLRRQYPQSVLQVWLVDYEAGLEVPDGLSLRPIAEAVTVKRWLGLQMRYSILELSTAVKAAVFLQIFREGAGSAVYMDPDLYLFTALSEMESLLADGAGGVLLPHLLTPLPKDGHNPDDLAILRSGVFNLGFLALRASDEAEQFLAWWDEWLETQCWADPTTGVFTDQKWLDFAPCFWPGIRVLRHPGYDVAYWNLHERILTEHGGTWQVNGEALRFFHFSGFDPFIASKLSKHENRYGNVKRQSPIGQLLDLYSQRLLILGHKTWSKYPLPQPYFDNGQSCDDVCRRCYAIATERGLTFSEPLKTGSGTFYAWMRERELGSVHPRYVHALLALRPDVRAAYPDFERTQAEALRRWIANNGQAQMHLDSVLLEIMGILHKGHGHIPDATPPVNYVGYLRAEMGVGEAARGYVRALQSVGIQTALMDLSHLTVHRAGDTSIVTDPPESMAPAPHAINIVHVNADTLPMTLTYLGENFCAGRFTVGLWAWESLDFPEHWHDRFGMVDEIWVGSHFMADAIGRHAPCPVVVMPYVVAPPRLAPDRLAFGLAAEEFVFLFSFDFHSVSARKNPEGLISAFRKAFKPEDPVRLLLKTISGDAHPEAMEQIQSLIGDARVQILDGTLDRMDQIRLMQSCDSFISLHRLEGFGLGLAEAMSLGKPVIATAYGGNTDFMNVGNSLLIPCEMVPLTENKGPYHKGSLWADPDLDIAVAAMQRLVTDKNLREELGRRAQVDITRLCGADAVGTHMLERLREIALRQSTARSRGKPVVLTASTPKRRIRLASAFFSDLLRAPNHYLVNSGRAFAYWRRMGTRTLVQRMVEELRRRG